MRFNETKEITAVLLTVSKNFNVGMHSDFYGWIWLKLRMIVDSIYIYTSLIGLDSKSQECEKAKTSAPVISQGFSMDLGGIWYTVEPWYNEPHTQLILSIRYSKERTLRRWVVFRQLLADFF